VFDQGEANETAVMISVAMSTSKLANANPLTRFKVSSILDPIPVMEGYQ
jgi:hypothetical protein